MDALNRINQWSDFLNAPIEHYNLKRNEDIKEYILGRKKKRDFEWFIKRLNYNSLLMVMKGRRNNRRYVEIVEEFHNSFLIH